MDCLGLGSNDDSSQFAVASMDYAGALVMCCLKEKKVGYLILEMATLSSWPSCIGVFVLRGVKHSKGEYL